MTRPIRFRAWDREAKKFVHADLTGSGVALDDRGVELWDKYEPWQQFTGLQDKNGVDIYEGDIVRMVHDENRVVIYSAPGFWLAKDQNDPIDVDQFSTPGVQEEVIGNIHENQELVK